MNKNMLQAKETAEYYIESAKAQYIRSVYNKGIDEKEDIHIEQYSDAIILPVRCFEDRGITRGLCGVIDDREKYVESSAISNLFQGSYHPETVIESDNSAMFLGCDHSHWGHFLMNVVPRVWPIVKKMMSADEYIIIRNENSNDAGLLRNENIFFEILGCADKVKVITKPTKYRKVFVPEISYSNLKYLGTKTDVGFYHHYFRDSFDFVKTVALKRKFEITEKLQDKIFFSIKGKKYEAWNLFFQKNGYAIIFAEEIDLYELVHILHSAKKIAYMSGTLNHNLLFGPDGIEVIALERRIMVSIFQLDVDMIKNLRVTYVNAQYSFIPWKKTEAQIVAFTNDFICFAAENKMVLDLSENRSEYLHNAISLFITKYTWDESWNYKDSPTYEYYLDSLEQDIEELSSIINENLKIDNQTSMREIVYWKKYIENLKIIICK